jgi:hypothetical protein
LTAFVIGHNLDSKVILFDLHENKGEGNVGICKVVEAGVGWDRTAIGAEIQYPAAVNGSWSQPKYVIPTTESSRSKTKHGNLP